MEMVAKAPATRDWDPDFLVVVEEEEEEDAAAALAAAVTVSPAATLPTLEYFVEPSVQI